MQITAADARRLLMHAQGLLDDPAAPGRGTPAAIGRLIRRLGFVQIDTINVVERAHHLILSTRADGYTPASLDALQHRRVIFEHWTHDASLIHVDFFTHWRPRFQRYRAASWHLNQLGGDADRVIAEVRDRIRAGGPLRSKDFEHNGTSKANSWWDWKPHKLALDYLWRTGELFIVAREGFQKVYDLTARAVPHLHETDSPESEAHVDWACTSALERLGTANPREIAWFWNAVKSPLVQQWIKRALEDGKIVPVTIESADDGSHRPAYALHDIARRRRNVPEVPRRTRLICPFDPVIRDRARLQRLFNFTYSFEGFVPSAKRRHGYYVMPILEGDRFVGRVDPKFHRDRGVLEIKRVWWEPGVVVTRARKSNLLSAVERVARTVGAKDVKLPTY